MRWYGGNTTIMVSWKARLESLKPPFHPFFLLINLEIQVRWMLSHLLTTYL
ncbi:hypothetical protein HanPI659440_Chr14g0546241 [Helianthus annuus]|nr:hypothetical protein HanPI659440_Chr14g0546241 [Helianthus annuus]